MDERDMLIVEVRERLARMETLLNTEVSSLKDRVAKLEAKEEEKQTWNFRQLASSIATIVTTVVATIFVFYITK